MYDGAQDYNEGLKIQTYEETKVECQGEVGFR